MATAKTPAEKRRIQSEERRALKKKYVETKKLLLEKEKDNFKSLYLVETHDGWYKMFGNSAVVYAFQLAPRLKLRPRLMPDTDYDCKSEQGVVSFRSREDLESHLKKLKIFPRFAQDGITIYDLGYANTAEDINLLIQKEDITWQKVNQILMPKVALPELRNELRLLMKAVHENVRKMDAPARAAVGSRMDENVTRMFADFALMSNGWIDEIEFLQGMERKLAELDADMMVVTELKIVSADKTFRIATQLEKVRKKTVNNLKDAKNQKQKIAEKLGVEDE